MANRNLGILGVVRLWVSASDSAGKSSMITALRRKWGHIVKKAILVVGLPIVLIALALTIASAKDSDDFGHSGTVPPTPSGNETGVLAGGATHSLPPQLRHTPGPTPVAYGARAVSPPVTEASVRDYVSSANGLSGVSAPLHLTISSIQFLTVEQLRDQLGIPNYLSYYAAASQVVYVQLAGPFGIDPGGANQTQINATHGYMLFDRKSGNLIATGAK
jgi:hypothetical protein